MRPVLRIGRTIAVLSFALAVTMATSGCGTLGQLASHIPFVGGGDADSGEGAPRDFNSGSLEEAQAMMIAYPKEPYWPFRAAEIYAASDSARQAVPLLQAALRSDPRYAPAAALLSKLYYDMGAFDEAATLLEGFIAAHPDAPDALRAALALHLDAMGESQRADSVLNACSRGSKEARAARTFVGLRGDDFQSVLAAAEQAVEDDPRSAASHNNYGIALLLQGRPIEARKAFLAALDLDDRLPGALYNMAIVEAFFFYDEEAARRWFARYKERSTDDPDDLETYFGADLSKRSNASLKK